MSTGQDGDGEEQLYGGFERAKDTNFGPGRQPTRAGAASMATGSPVTALLGQQSSASQQRLSLRTSVATRAGGPNTVVRPMTSKQGAGFSPITTSPVSGGGGGGAQQQFDPMRSNGSRSGPASPVPGADNSDSGEEGGGVAAVRAAEQRCLQSLTDSYQCARVADHRGALDKAKDAVKKERAAFKLREKVAASSANANAAAPATVITAGTDLTFMTLFNLADQYDTVGLQQESLNAYAALVKGKQFAQAGKLRVNMGEIHFRRGDFAQAIKMFRMALDQVSPATNVSLRMKILRNIAVAHIKLGQFKDAADSLEAIMETQPDFRPAYNLVICYFAMGDVEGMRSAFLRLVSIPLPVFDSADDDGEGGDGADDAIEHSTASDRRHVNMDDELRRLHRERRKAIEMCVFQTARVIAPVIDASFQLGFDWVIQTVKQSPMAHVAGELDMAKVINILKANDTATAIEQFRAFEKKERRMMSAAATNLSFLFLLGGDADEAETYSQLAVQSDRYSAYALVNRGVCAMNKGDFAEARRLFLDAITVDSLCAEAHFNLGLLLKQMGSNTEALAAFEKLHALLQSDPSVVFHIADLCGRIGKPKEELEWYNRLVSLVPTDPSVLARMAHLYQVQNNQAQAFHYYSESYRYFPCNLDVLTWLGTYCVEHELYEQAINYFERAVLIQPREFKWPLMIAGCMRRSGNYQQALSLYRATHERFPQNLECLRLLVRMCNDLGLADASGYAAKITQIEQQQQEKQRRESVATTGPDGGDVASPIVAKNVDKQLQGGGEPDAKGSAEVNVGVHWDDDAGDDLLPD